MTGLEEARAAASRIVKDAMRAADIIARIRLLLHEESSATELVDINEVIREMVVLLRGEQRATPSPSGRSSRRTFARWWEIACNYSRS